jgi:hypothetical protein
VHGRTLPCTFFRFAVTRRSTGSADDAFPCAGLCALAFPSRGRLKKAPSPDWETVLLRSLHTIFLRSLRAFYFFFAAAAVRRRLVAFERDGAALALKLSGAERVRSIEELRQVLDRVTVEVVNGLLDAEFFDLV